MTKKSMTKKRSPELKRLDKIVKSINAHWKKGLRTPQLHAAVLKDVPDITQEEYNAAATNIATQMARDVETMMENAEALQEERWEFCRGAGYTDNHQYPSDDDLTDDLPF